MNFLGEYLGLEFKEPPRFFPASKFAGVRDCFLPGTLLLKVDGAVTAGADNCACAEFKTTFAFNFASSAAFNFASFIF